MTVASKHQNRVLTAETADDLECGRRDSNPIRGPWSAPQGFAELPEHTNVSQRELCVTVAKLWPRRGHRRHAGGVSTRVWMSWPHPGVPTQATRQCLRLPDAAAGHSPAFLVSGNS